MAQRLPWGRLAVLAAVAGLVAAYFLLGLHQRLTLAELKASRDGLAAWYQAHRLLGLGGYFLFYVLVVGLGLPGAAVISLAGGAVFGFWTGLIVVSFASSLGALACFLLSRFVLRNWVARRFSGTMARINRGVEREGAFYLFTLRLIPLFPFFAINLAMGLTSMRASTFYWVSQLGMLPGTAVFINAGVQLGRVGSVSDLFTWQLLASLALLGVFPLIVRRVVALVRAGRTDHKDHMDPTNHTDPTNHRDQGGGR